MTAGRGYHYAHDLFARHAALIDANSPVPACPAWDVHALLAHQVHQLSSATDGTFPIEDSLEAILGPDETARSQARARQDRWIATGVATLLDTPVATLLAKWDELVDRAPEPALEGLFPDVAVHLFDLLGVAADDSHRDDDFVREALRFWADHCATRLAQVGRGPIRFELVAPSEGRDAIGPADARLVVTATAFELLRSIVGRRSLTQVRRLRWRDADDVAIESFSLYGWRGTDLNE